ncbi:MAG: hypothetical protein A2651_02165 [Candidatus Yanofskybacteria bacterium RIFCSPHIGHO2_01_FULL_42_12]|uniref:Uridylate kinase n=1 Tax=Candidatus Yanofskybacteria bacterium RIFCSPLOWO2_01_FULL_42_49 TaxID=1802694 RepID=A0A1F8GBQ3_9BACT|nr:MAG: hypothetical protein A2651_02165 [Candidatus Yanofskybacteria bacterium RIFCSPHIGHO2_01_FULL_42_12]OGN22763.1 MAG: hypothetical protein A2918_01320 [Candidatus Yanofskybacteria bacterium RIFCSPLOWO2_01_FULL_42_49]
MNQEKETVLLKISGESLSGQGKFGISRPPLEFMIHEIQTAMETLNIGLAIVIGGGNILRGADLKKNVFEEDTAAADYMGMLATMINCVGFKKKLKQHGVESRVMSAIRCDDVCEPYHYEVALSHLEKGRVVILAGGSGMPNLSTDMTMVMRAKELEIQTVLKGTKVDGIYTENPINNLNAVFIPQISHDDYLALNLKIINFEAVGFAREHHIPIRVFNFFKEGNLRQVLVGKNIGSVIR